MKISEVAQITGLTKKAINHYEEEGLIKPVISHENNYREYSQSDIDKLIQISVLRQIEVPVKDIREIISNPEILKDRLKQHLVKLDAEVKKLEKSKSILNSCLEDLDSSNSGLAETTKKLSALNTALDMDARGREGYMKNQLQRIFPGNFGRMLVAYYSPFLNEALDTPEKEEAWLKLVKFLDEVEHTGYSEEMDALYKQLSEEDLEKHEKFALEEARKWIGITDEEMSNEKERLKEILKRMNSDADVKLSMEKTMSISGQMKEQMKNINYYSQFVENLKILSSDYKIFTMNKEKLYKSLESFL